MAVGPLVLPVSLVSGERNGKGVCLCSSVVGFINVWKDIGKLNRYVNRILKFCRSVQGPVVTIGAKGCCQQIRPSIRLYCGLGKSQERGQIVVAGGKSLGLCNLSYIFHPFAVEVL